MNIIDQYDGNFESLTSTPTNSNIIFEQITAGTTTQYSEIAKLLGIIAANFTNSKSAELAAVTDTAQNTSGSPRGNAGAPGYGWRENLPLARALFCSCDTEPN